MQPCKPCTTPRCWSCESRGCPCHGKANRPLVVTVALVTVALVTAVLVTAVLVTVALVTVMPVTVASRMNCSISCSQ